MTKKVINSVKSFVPTEPLAKAIDEHANNGAAVSGGLAVGDLYLTSGVVMSVTT